MMPWRCWRQTLGATRDGTERRTTGSLSVYILLNCNQPRVLLARLLTAAARHTLLCLLLHEVLLHFCLQSLLVLCKPHRRPL